MVFKKMAAIAATIFMSAGVSGAQSLPSGSGDWNGFYGGLSYSSFDESDDGFSGGVYFRTLDFSGSGLGAFAGYNVQRGAMVYGGELAFNGVTNSVVGGGNTITHSDYLDLKGRAGYARGPFLFYGVLGYSRATVNESPGNVDEKLDGWNYGFGIDYNINHRFFMGAEILGRKMKGDFIASGFPAESYETDSRSITFRAGMKF